MKRRNALKLLGVIVGCFMGRYVIADEAVFINQPPMKFEPMNIQINEATTENIIILRKDGSKLTIPFSEVIEALKE